MKDFKSHINFLPFCLCFIMISAVFGFATLFCFFKSVLDPDVITSGGKQGESQAGAPEALFWGL